MTKKLYENSCSYSKLLFLIICLSCLFIITGCNDSKEEVKEDNNTSNTNTEAKEENKTEKSYLAKVSDNFDVKKFDAKKFNGLVYKKDEEFDIKDIIEKSYQENNYYLQYEMDGFVQVKDQDESEKKKSDVLDSKANYYYNALGEPSSICGIYYDSSYDGPTGLIEFVWQYDEYSIRMSVADYSNWKEGKPTSTKFLGVTAYLNENAENEVKKSINYWDKDGKTHEKKCVGIDLLK